MSVLSQWNNEMLVGITGGIGMGKTTVLKDFRELGADVLDADEIAHGLYEPGGLAYEALVSHWGASEILDVVGRIDRKLVGAKVFGDAQELSWLNGVMHPLIRSEIKRLADGSRCGVVYCAVPLLYESGWVSDFGKVVSVWCCADSQQERLLKRGWSEEEIRRRVGSQLSADEKLRRSDYGIITDCSWEMLRSQCASVHARIEACASVLSAVR